MKNHKTLFIDIFLTIFSSLLLFQPNFSPPFIMTSVGEEKKKLKIAIIDSGVEYRCESFLREECKGLSKCPEEIWRIDTIIGKAVYFPENKKVNKSELPSGDVFGHGTYCAAIAAGRKVKVSLYGTFPLSIEGAAAEEAEVYSYKVIWESDEYCIIKKETIDAFKAAIAHKVDVISLSLVNIPAESYYLDAFARGSFLAMKHGILTVAAAGNEGPEKQTVTNVAPWILTVGASTSTRKFETVLEVDHKMQYKGSSINPFDSEELPFICYSPELERKKLQGKIVYCDNFEDMELAKSAGASGIVFGIHKKEPYALAYENVPFVWVNYRDAKKIRRYLSCRFEVKAKILKSVRKLNETCQVVDFSSRGPNSITPEILKPDLIAPGVEICVPSLDLGKYTVVNGTSFACPYVAGIAALIKRAFEKDNLKPSPAQIHSALVTSASPLTTGKSDVFAQGAGLVNPMNALVPGLVYDRDENHYTKFLNGQGYTRSKKKELNCSSRVREKIEASELNYPTITIVVPKDQTQYSKSIPRRVTCLGTTSCRYQAEVKIDENIEGNTIEVKPETLHFDEKIREQEFTVLFDVNKEYWTTPVITASLQWISEKDESGKNHIVKSPIVIYCQ